MSDYATELLRRQLQGEPEIEAEAEREWCRQTDNEADTAAGTEVSDVTSVPVGKKRQGDRRALTLTLKSKRKPYV